MTDLFKNAKINIVDGNNTVIFNSDGKNAIPLNVK